MVPGWGADSWPGKVPARVPDKLPGNVPGNGEVGLSSSSIPF